MLYVEEWVQESQLTQLTEDKWILVEFWATWCKPCHQVYSHIEQFQELNRNDLYVISMTKENPGTVRQFLSKKPMKTAIAIDVDGKTHDQFNIRQIPKAVLIAPDGSVKWQGHPSELSHAQLSRIIHQKDKINSIPINRKIRVIPRIDKITAGPKYMEHDYFKWREITPDIGSRVMLDAQSFHFTGSLKSLLAYTLSLPEALIHDEIDSIPIEIISTASNWETHKWDIIHTILEQQKRKVEHQKVSMKVMRMELIDTTKLWKCDYMDWPSDAPKYMIGDQELQANNMSTVKFAELLSNVIDALVIVQNPDQVPHDWDIHFKYPDLMIEQFREDYGIELGPAKEEVIDIISITNPE